MTAARPNATPITTALHALRSALRRAPHDQVGSFADVQERFLDLVVGGPLEAAASRASLPELDELVRAVVGNTLGPAAARDARVRLHRVVGTDFYHGSFVDRDGVGCFFWFEDDREGLVSICHADGWTTDVRVSAVRGHTFPMRSPPGIH